MKIKLTGTGAITAPQQSASCLIDGQLLVDCGNGLIKAMMNNDIDIYNIDTILITHMHADHFFDVPFIILLRSFKKMDNELKIYGPKKLIDSVNKLFEVGYADIKDWRQHLSLGKTIMEEFDDLDIETNHYHIKSHLVDHGEFAPAYGFTIDDGCSVLGYSGDSSYCKAIDEIIDMSDISILDCSFPKGNPSHMGLDNLVEILEKYDDKEIIVTHMSQESRKEALKIESENLLVLEDMVEVEI